MRKRFALAIIGALTATAALAMAAEGPRIGQVKTATGEAVILRGSMRSPAKPGDTVYLQDVIETGEKGSIGISLIDNTVFSIGPNSEFALMQFHLDATGGAMLADMPKGTLSVVSGDITKKSPGAMKISIPTGVLNVRGTTFAIQVIGR